jgi:hypothetical protein
MKKDGGVNRYAQINWIFLWKKFKSLYSLSPYIKINSRGILLYIIFLMRLAKVSYMGHGSWKSKLMEKKVDNPYFIKLKNLCLCKTISRE